MTNSLKEMPAAAYWRTLVCLLALFLSGVPGSARSQPVTENPDVQSAIAVFSGWLEGQLAYRNLPGVVVGVVAGDELVWSQGFGYADLAAQRPMQADTRFRMASHSKLFTATAIMQLREEGKLRLDDPVSEYLPWFQHQRAEGDDPPITIEQLLTHYSGLPREAGSHWSDYEFPTADELRALMPDRQAAFSPETRWKYSNLAYTLAGMVVEAVSGMSWAQYIQGNILDPLDMKASSVDVNEPGLATGYGRRMPDGSREVMPFVDARSMASATGLSSTVEDMARFVSAQFRRGPRGDERILSTASLREMHRVRVMGNDWKHGQGIGFRILREGDAFHVGHGGGYPGYTTHTRINLDTRVGVIVLTNTLDSYPSEMSRELMKTVGDAVAAATAASEEEPAWDPAWERFIGLYRNRWADTRVLRVKNGLALLRTTAPTIDTSVTLEPLGDGRFLMQAPGGGGPVGEVVYFAEEDGKVVRMVTGDSYSLRVD